MMGKECEREEMNEAAIANYEKAIALYPDNPTAQKRLKKLKPQPKKIINNGKEKRVFQKL